jgi:hypothetical protein
MTTKVSMLVKCEKCGYENFPQHRFCGMCAAPLPFPTAPSLQPTPPPPRPAPKPVIRPAPVAVQREPVDTRSLSYLLEDEPAPSHRGKYLLSLMLLLIALALVGWHWRGDLLSIFAGSFGSKTQASSPVAAGGESAGSEVTKPGVQADAPPPAAQAQTPAAAGTDSTTSSSAPASSPSLSSADQSQSSDSVPAAKPDDSGQAATQAEPAPKPSKVRAQPATTVSSRGEDLEAEGEKYLYGNGVPENCTRARTNLLAAAQHSNAQAQNVLGTMYATGHCATRDLPTAYRWFSRSLRKDPSNTRIEQDLKVLWNQMTPEERQLALRDQR